MSVSVRWVAWTALVRGPRAPASASSCVGVTPYAARQSAFSATCSERWTCSGASGRQRGDRGEVLARDGTDGVDRGADDGAVISAQLRGSDTPGVRIGVEEAQLRRMGGRVTEPGPQVRGVEQGDPDPGLLGRLDQRERHRVGLVVRRAAGLVPQVVELAHRGDPGAAHLPVRRDRELEVRVRVEPLGRGVHLLPPGPERAAALAGSGRGARGGRRASGSSRGRGASDPAPARAGARRAAAGGRRREGEDRRGPSTRRRRNRRRR